MKLDRLTEKGQEAMVAADTLVEQYKNNQLEPEHLLLALLDQSGGIAAQIVTKLGASPDRLRTRVEGGGEPSVQELRAAWQDCHFVRHPQRTRSGRKRIGANERRLRQHRTSPDGSGFTR